MTVHYPPFLFYSSTEGLPLTKSCMHMCGKRSQASKMKITEHINLEIHTTSPPTIAATAAAAQH